MSPILLSRAFYFFFFAAAVALSPFLALYYEHIGLSGTQIGVLRGLSPLLMLFSAPLWGALADATQKHKRLLLLAIGGMLGSVFALSQTTTYGWLILIAIIMAFAGAPITTLVDNTVIELLGHDKDKYGRQRLWGAVGWGITGPIVGILSQRSGQQWFFITYLVLMTGCWLVAVQLPIRQSPIRQEFWKDARHLLSNQAWTTFLLSLTIGGLHLALVNNYLFLHLKQLGASETLMGLSLTFSTLGELPVWFFSDAMLRRWGTKGMLIFSLSACVIQAFGYAWMPVPWLILPLQLLHGPVFSAMWAAGVAYAAEIAPEGMQATAQGIFGGVAMGLKTALGAFIGGILYEHVGMARTFQWGGVAALVGLIIFVWPPRP